MDQNSEQTQKKISPKTKSISISQIIVIASIPVIFLIGSFAFLYQLVNRREVLNNSNNNARITNFEKINDNSNIDKFAVSSDGNYYSIIDNTGKVKSFDKKNKLVSTNDFESISSKENNKSIGFRDNIYDTSNLNIHYSNSNTLYIVTVSESIDFQREISIYEQSDLTNSELTKVYTIEESSDFNSSIDLFSKKITISTESNIYQFDYSTKKLEQEISISKLIKNDIYDIPEPITINNQIYLTYTNNYSDYSSEPVKFIKINDQNSYDAIIPEHICKQDSKILDSSSNNKILILCKSESETYYLIYDVNSKETKEVSGLRNGFGKFSDEGNKIIYIEKTPSYGYGKFEISIYNIENGKTQTLSKNNNLNFLRVFGDVSSYEMIDHSQDFDTVDENIFILNNSNLYKIEIEGL